MARGQMVRTHQVSRDRKGTKYRKWLWCVSRPEQKLYLAGLKFHRAPYSIVLLSPMEAKVMAALILCEVGPITIEDLELFVYDEPLRMPEGFRGCLRVTVHRLRYKIKHMEINIKHTRGWELIIL